MMDLGVLGIEPRSLEIVAFDPIESTKGTVLTLLREHRLNQKYLKFHMESIYAGNFSGELQLTSAQQTLE